MKRLLLLLLLISCTPASIPTVNQQTPQTNGLRCIEGETTIFIMNNLMRVDMVGSHAIYTEEAMYTWKESKGTVMKFADLESIAAEMDEEYASPRETIDEIKNSANCVPVDVDDAMFVPPDGVEFSDLTEMVKQLEQVVTDLK